MNWTPAFRRKVVYIAIMAALLLPLAWISQPATVQDAGGVLARMRVRYGLSEADLGDVDPASETMKLATLGMRGVATAILWSRINEFKLKEDWDSLRVALDQLSKLQPHFVEVWRFQAHNLSYNISVEFDDYRYRYHWVKKGIAFLMEGVRYNRRDPRLLSDLGWFFGQKIGRSDEHRQFRRMFHEDHEFHATLPLDLDDPREGARDYQNRVDNWLVSRLWYLKAEDLVDKQGVPIRGKIPLLFYSDAPMALTSYARAIEDDGYFGEQVEYQWTRAGRVWRAYGDRDLPTPLGVNFRLNELESLRANIEKLRKQFDDLAPGLREKMLQKREDSLTDAEREALDTPARARTADQQQLVAKGRQKLNVTHMDVAKRMPKPLRPKARVLAARLGQLEARRSIVERNRSIVNFEYWRTRCEAEKTENAVDARRYLYRAQFPKDPSDLVGRKKSFEKAWEKWAQVYKQFPSLMEDPAVEDLLDRIEDYRKLLGQLDEPFPQNFKLQKLLDMYREEPLEEDATSPDAKKSESDD